MQIFKYIICASFLIAASIVVAQASKDPVLKKWAAKCEDGQAQFCHMYGSWLEENGTEKERTQGRQLVARACRMAYAPACQGRKISSEPTAVDCRGLLEGMEFSPMVAKDAVTMGREVVRVGNHKAWAQVGVGVGDLILRVNGRPFEGRLGRQRKYEIEKEVNGTRTTVTIQCEGRGRRKANGNRNAPASATAATPPAPNPNQN